MSKKKTAIEKQISKMVSKDQKRFNQMMDALETAAAALIEAKKVIAEVSGGCSLVSIDEAIKKILAIK